MPPWLYAPLGLVAGGAIFFVLAWLVARDRLPRPVQVAGWASVLVTLVGVGWSFWAETARPYFRAQDWAALTRAGGQLVTVGMGLVLMIKGARHFWQAWNRFDWDLTGGLRGFLEDSPAWAQIRRQSRGAARWRSAARLLGAVLRLPGLGLVLVGWGLVVGAFQLLEPDLSLRPDPMLVKLSQGLVFLGVLLHLARRREDNDGSRPGNAGRAGF